ncbi:hypothetical protein [Actinoplanes rectilineatus]|uniref:hypothetical protein n=1 Tax=Actinoplanes rectilineatus TaxID=113571 RepID=UPI0005F29137|nr:hypothetical protein [Actinoplanes rectilineatus]
MTTTSIAPERQAVLDGLRDLAAFLAENPDVPARDVHRVEYCVSADDDRAGLAKLAAIAAALGVEVTGGPDHFAVYRRFGNASYRAFYVSRAEMADYNAVMSYRDSVRADRPAPRNQDATVTRPSLSEGGADRG